MENDKLTIGRVAKLAGTPVSTIRYYERLRLIPLPERSASGYRLYERGCVQRLVFIRNAKTLGFSLKEIASLLALSGDRRGRCADVKRRAEAKLQEIDRRIKNLREIKRALTRLTERCEGGRASLDRCPILNIVKT